VLGGYDGNVTPVGGVTPGGRVALGGKEVGRAVDSGGVLCAKVGVLTLATPRAAAARATPTEDNLSNVLRDTLFSGIERY